MLNIYIYIYIYISYMYIYISRQRSKRISHTAHNITLLNSRRFEYKLFFR